MANFEPIFEWVLRQEDGLLSGVIKNLGDDAGFTRLGITQKAHPELSSAFWSSMPLVDALNVARTVYHKLYWDRFMGDDVDSDDVASCLFSFSINDGDSREIIMLQEIVGVPVDGDMGPTTLAATNRLNPTKLAAALRTEQANFYLDLAKTRLDIASELPGLLARARRVYPSLVP